MRATSTGGNRGVFEASRASSLRAADDVVQNDGGKFKGANVAAAAAAAGGGDKGGRNGGVC